MGLFFVKELKNLSLQGWSLKALAFGNFTEYYQLVSLELSPTSSDFNETVKKICQQKQGIIDGKNILITVSSLTKEVSQKRGGCLIKELVIFSRLHSAPYQAITGGCVSCTGKEVVKIEISI